MSKAVAPAPAVEIERDYDTPEGVRAALRAAKDGDHDARETIARRLSWIIGGEIPYADSEIDELIAVAEAGWNSILSHPDCAPEDMYQYAVDILWDDEGNVIEENAADGAAWILRAAENEHPDAQLEAGRLYYEGLGVRKSLELAAEWFRKAAQDELNAENAAYFLGEIKRQSRAPFPKTTKPAAKSKAKPVKKAASSKKKAAPAKKAASAKKAVPAKKKAAPAKKKVAAKKTAKPVSTGKKTTAAKAKKPVAKTKAVKKTAKPAAKPAKKKAPAKKRR